MSDQELIRLWVNRQSPRSRRFSWQTANHFRMFVKKPLAQVTLADIQTFAATMRARKLAPRFYKQTLLGLKSLFAFGQHTRILPAIVPLHRWPVRQRQKPANASVSNFRGLFCAFFCAFFWVELPRNCGDKLSRQKSRRLQNRCRKLQRSTHQIPESITSRAIGSKPFSTRSPRLKALLLLMATTPSTPAPNFPVSRIIPGK